MSGETILPIIGNLTSDPELRYTQNGKAVANFTIASTPRNFDRADNEWKDGAALFMRCTVWGDVAEYVASSLHKGYRVIAIGRLSQREYETKATDTVPAQKRSSIELAVDEIGPSLRYATAEVHKIISESDAAGMTGHRADSHTGELVGAGTGKRAKGDDTPF